MEPKSFTCALKLALCVALVCMLPYVTGAGAAKLGCRVKRPPTQAQKLCASSVQALCKRCASTVQAVCKQGHFVCKLGFSHIPTLCVYHGFSCLKLRPSTLYIILVKGKSFGNVHFFAFVPFPTNPDRSERPGDTFSRILPRHLCINL